MPSRATLPRQCNYCPMTFSDSVKYRNHQRTHIGRRRNNVPCYFCTLTCLSDNLTHHLKKHLPRPNCTVCLNCKFAWFTPYGFERDHRGSCPYKCPGWEKDSELGIWVRVGTDRTVYHEYFEKALSIDPNLATVLHPLVPLSSNSAVTNVNTHVDDDSSSNHNHLDPNVFNFNSVPPASFQPTPRFDTHVSQNLFDQSLGFAPEGTSDETSYFPHPLPPQGLQYPSHGFLNEQFYPNPLPSAQTQHSYNYQYPPPPLPLQGPQGPSRATHHDQHYDDQFYHVHNNFVQNQSSYNYQYPPQSNSLRKLPLSHRQTLLYGV